MDRREWEGTGQLVRRYAGIAEDIAAPPVGIVSRLPWVERIASITKPAFPRAWRAENDDGLDVIYVHRAALEPARGWLVMGEGVEGYLARLAHPPVQHEMKRVVWGVAAATIMPRYTLRCALSHYGLDLPKLANLFGVSQTILVRRIAEIRETPCAIVGAAHTLRLGLSLTDAQLASIVRKGTSSEWQVLRLTDARVWVVWPKDW